MAKHIYKIGDKVALKGKALQTLKPGDLYKVLATLPETGGVRQYRVRSESETYERVVPEDDIDHEHSSPAGGAGGHKTSHKETGPWLKGNNVKTVK